MTVRCLDCSRFNLRDADKALARAGFGCCELKKKNALVSATYWRECGHHDPVPAPIFEKRVAWLQNARA